MDEGLIQPIWSGQVEDIEFHEMCAGTFLSLTVLHRCVWRSSGFHWILQRVLIAVAMLIKSLLIRTVNSVVGLCQLWGAGWDMCMGVQAVMCF